MKSKCIVACATLVLFASCNDVADEYSQMSDVEVSFTTQILTRVQNNQWEGGEEIGVYMHTYGSELSDASVWDNSSNCKYLVSSSNTVSPATEMDKLYYPKSGGVNFIAYYPFSNVENYAVNLDVSNQTIPSEIDFLYSNNLKNLTAVASAQELKFQHQLSKISFNITAGYGVEQEDLSGLTVTVRNAITSASFSLSNGGIVLSDDVIDVKAVVAEKDNSIQAEAIMIPQESNDVFVIISLAEGRNFMYRLAGNQAWISGYKYSYEVSLTDQTVNAALTATISDWTDGGNGVVESVASSAWDGATTNVSWYSAELTAMTLYQPADLAGLAKLVNEGNSFEGKTIHLAGNLDMNNKAWTPIGNSLTTPFKGTFIGNNHHVKNVNPTLTGTNNMVGLFGLSYGNIEKLSVSGDYNIVYDNVQYLYIGGICAINEGNVANCRSYADVVARMAKATNDETNMYVGGVVGQNNGSLELSQNYGSISGVNVNTTVKAYLHVGGVAGSNTGTITGCENTRNLTGSNGNVRMGGIVAISSKLPDATRDVLVENCSNIGNVIIETSHNEAMAGGIVGKNASGSVVQEVINKGTVEATMATGSKIYGGGVVGMNDAATISSGENRGNITVVGAVDTNTDDEEGTGAVAGGVVGYNINGAQVHQGVNSGMSAASVASYCFSGGICGYNSTQNPTAYVYACCINNGMPTQEVGNATVDDDLVTDTEHSHE